MNGISRMTRLSGLSLLFFAAWGCTIQSSTTLDVNFRDQPNRPWPGSNLWANRIQDWRVQDGRLEARSLLPMRTAHILSRRADPALGEVVVTVRLGLVGGESASNQAQEEVPETESLDDQVAVGIILGAGGPDLDSRRVALIHHSSGPGAGLFLGIDQGGRLFVADFANHNLILARSEEAISSTTEVDLEIRTVPSDGGFTLDLSATPVNAQSGTVALESPVFPASTLTGGLALASHAPGDSEVTGWFSHLRIEGGGIELVENGELGPILGAQHTLSRGRLRLTAQLFPVSGPADGAGPGVADSVRLEFLEDGGGWATSAVEAVVVPGYTATFQVNDWPGGGSVGYRLSYIPGPGHGEAGNSYQGTIRTEPTEKEELVVAAFTGNHNVASPGVDRGEFDWENHVWFPHDDIVSHIRAHDPDFLFFSGDQVYEGASPTRADFENPYQDYLYKWYLWLWAYRDLTSEIPSVTIPDDHDVFHGNVWGAGGRTTPPGLSGAAAQDQGGYKLPPEWVNMVQRTHTAHLPLPVDPEPSDYGYETYFTDLLYGGVSFAVVEDRKYKSPPKLLVPEADVWNGWAQNPAFHAPSQSDVPGASLLGTRQEEFLEEWADDWTDGTWMKVLLSQTIFANVATIPADAMSGSVIPSLPIPEPGSWVDGDKVAADMDSNGWPSSGRNRAITAIRKGFAVHLAGDQHLASTIQYGVDDWGDGPFALCVPSVANFWPRRWYPPAPGLNRTPDSPLYTGDLRDGFGNLMTVFAVSNPAQWGHEPAVLHDRAPGYGIARFNRITREVSLEAWPRWADPTSGERPYPGWPVSFHQEDGFGKEPWGYLPTLVIEGMANPVVQLVSEFGGEVVYTLRIQGNRYTPKVFTPGTYSLRVGELGTASMQVFLGLEGTPQPDRILEVSF